MERTERIVRWLLWRRTTCIAVCACAFALAATPSAAQSERCGQTGRPWVALVFASGDFGAAWKRSVLADLRAGLRLRGIDVCMLGAEGSAPPLALVQVGSAARDHVSVSIDVHDAITEKRVLRDVDLRRVTPDGTGLVVAQAAEELLRASWAELALLDAPTPARAPPPEVEAAVATRVPQSRSPQQVETGLVFAVQHHTGGVTLIGGDVFVSAWLGSRVGIEAAAGLRDGLRTQTALGSVEHHGLALRAEMLLSLLPRQGRHDLIAKLGTELLRMRFDGRPSTGAAGEQRDATAMSARAALAARASITPPLRVCLELGAGLPLSAAVATEAGKSVLATTGVAVYGMAGAAVAF